MGPILENCDRRAEAMASVGDVEPLYLGRNLGQWLADLVDAELINSAASACWALPHFGVAFIESGGPYDPHRPILESNPVGVLHRADRPLGGLGPLAITR